MATKVEAATLVNRIVYKTDTKSLKAVRNDMKKLQQEFSKTASNAIASPVAARATVRNAKKIATQVMDAHIKAMEDVAKLRSKQAAKNVQNSYNKILGVNKTPGKSARDSANVFKKAFAEDNERVKRQNAEMARYTRDMLDQQKNVDKIRERIAREALLARRNQEKRDSKSGLRSNQLAFEVSRLNLGAKEARQFSRELENLNRRYRSGKIELDQYRESTRQLLRSTRDLSKEHMTLRERIGDLRKGGSGGLGFGGAIAGAGLIGAGALGYMGYSRAVMALQSAVLQSRGLSRVSSMGIMPEETQALQLAALRSTGFDLSFEKISDISKDVQDKIGQLSLGEWKQNKKTGDWSFSGGGEMADWLKIMTERGGFSREGALATLRSVKGPVELAVLLEGLRKSAKLTDSEFTALAEAINDFSYIAKSVGRDGENVVATLNELTDAGLLYTKVQRDNLKDLSDMSATFSKTADFMEGQFGAAFVQGLKDAGINSNNLSKELSGFVPVIQALGKVTGDLTGSLIKLGGAINSLLDWRKNFQASLGITQSDLPLAVIDPTSMSLSDQLTYLWDNWFSSGSNAPSAMYANQNNFGGNNPFNLPQYNLNITPAPVVVQVEPSEEFGNLIDARADQRIEWAFDDQNFQINQSILGE
ncbi:hypothetical protein EPNKCIFM_00073 [Klebsiella phage KP13-16]|nr:hypothetical protein EPNKCIFM_00073 [Klebsiella phage KP13-16]